MTVNDILLDAYRRLNYSDSPPTKVADRLKGFYNQRHRRLLSMPGMSKLRDDSISFTTTANTAIYSLPQSVGRITSMFDRTNQRPLDEQPNGYVRRFDPQTMFGSPSVWTLKGMRAVAQQPANATALFADSTSVSDTGQVYVEYTRTGGYLGRANVALTGTNSVQIGTHADIIAVNKFYVANAAVGTITLETASSGGSVLATIPAGGTFARYIAVQLFPTPGDSLTIDVDYTRNIPESVVLTDEPLLPLDFHYLLALGIRIDEYEHQEDDRRFPLEKEWKDGVRSLINFVQNNSGLVVVPGEKRPAHYPLGPNYPPGW